LTQAKSVAVQLIKTVVRRPWRDQPHFVATWYEPFAEQELIKLEIHWAMGRSGTFINTAGSIHVLPKILEAASHFDQAPTTAAMEAMVQSKGSEPLLRQSKQVQSTRL
jgi:hypothetical protein